ncbi:hypothetical protein EVAR_38726_1 [Eumeta japonica]|uniref:Uncharacterized protein n=1 Tax=Eumeta variegata TaxID=151549 RepID=A0A4C1YLX4_EUMVA|nr:hypothetical protein EVAR_38726_1 [Eumeta japonica]
MHLCILLKRQNGKNGNKRSSGWPLEGESRSRSILKNKEARGTDSELLIQETTSLGANISRFAGLNRSIRRLAYLQGDSGSESSPIRLKDFKGQNHKSGADSQKDGLVA